MKSGRSRAGQKAAGSHTAALAGSDAAVDAVFRQAGVIRADTLAGLLDVAALLSSQPVPRGRRVAVLTNAGGLGILCADACEAAGLELPQPSEATRATLAAALPAEASVANPVDMLGSATADSFQTALPVILADPGIDAVIALFVPTVSVEAADVGAAISRATAEANQPDKPVLAVILASTGAPGDAALRRQHPLVLLSRGRRQPRSAAPSSTGNGCAAPPAPSQHVAGIDTDAAAEVVATALAHDDEAWLDPAATRRLLAAYGIPLVGERVATTPDEAVAAAERARLPRRRQDRGGGSAQDGVGRRRARPRATRTPSGPPRRASAAPSSCSR